MGEKRNRMMKGNLLGQYLLEGKLCKDNSFKDGTFDSPLTTLSLVQFMGIFQAFLPSYQRSKNPYTGTPLIIHKKKKKTPLIDLKSSPI